MKKRYSIVFMGVDGAGKTTALKMTEKILSGYGIRFKSIYLGRWIKVKKVKTLSKKISKMENGIITKLKPIARDTLYVIKYWYLYFKMLTYRLSGNNIIGDRYIYDLKIEKDYCKFFNIFIDCLYPKPNLLVYLHADPKKIFARKGQWGVDELRRHQEIYKKVSDRKKGVLIKTDDLKKTEWEIARALAKKFSRKLYQ